MSKIDKAADRLMVGFFLSWFALGVVIFTVAIPAALAYIVYRGLT